MMFELRLTNLDSISFPNRDHVVAAIINEKEITVITTLGAKITIPTSPATAAKFAGELANYVGKQFRFYRVNPT
jgi:hypothetical protein